MTTLLRVLIVDDSDDDAQLILRHLRSADYDPQWERVDTPASMSSALDRESWDVILCDYKMPLFSSPEALKIIQARNLDIPFIMVSGAIGEETAVAAMKSGMHDYIMKDNLSRLSVAIEREIRDATMRQEKKKADAELKKSEENFRRSLDNSPQGVRIVTEAGETLYANRTLLDIYGYDSVEELKTIPLKKRYTQASCSDFFIRREKRRQGKYCPSEYEISIIRKDGQIRHLEVSRKEVQWNGEMQFQAFYNDISERKQIEHELRINQIELDMQNDELRQTQGELEATRINYADLYDMAPVGYLTVNEKGIILESNLTAANLLGTVRGKLTNQRTSKFIFKDDQDVFYHYLKQLNSQATFSHSRQETCELRMVKKDGLSFWARLEGIVAHAESGAPTYRIVISDITLRKQAEDLQHLAEENFRRSLDDSPLGVRIVNEDGETLYANQAILDIFGYDNIEELQQTSIRKRYTPTSFLEFIIRKEKRKKGDRSQSEYEIGIVRKNGDIRQLRVLRKEVLWNGQMQYQVLYQDITERKFQEAEREETALLILLVNQPGDFHERITELTASLKKWSGCEAVGIRLREGNDYPYYETRGFPSAFVQEEKHLCDYDTNGEFVRDEAGNPLLACMCGHVLAGRFNPALPFFTAGGSFWSNNTSGLLANSSEEDRRAFSRGRCISQGYESVALVPLRIGEHVFGLLQFNDHRPNRFTPSLIAHFERMAHTMAIALLQRQADEAVKASEERYRALVENIGEVIFTLDTSGRIIYISPVIERISTYKSGDLIGKSFTDFIYPDDLPRINESLSKTIQGGYNPFEFRILDGDQIRYVRTSSRVIINNGVAERIAGVLTDITEQKKAEKELQARTALLEAQTNSTIDGILVIDPNNQRILINGRIIELFNVPQYILDDNNDAKLLEHVAALTKYPEKFMENVLSLYEHKNEISRDEIEFKSGMILDRYTAPVLDKEGKYYGRIWTFRDITLRKKAENDLIEALKELQDSRDVMIQLEKQAVIGRMASRFAHEILNPVSIISSRLQFLADEKLAEAARENLQVSREQLERIVKIIRDLHQSSANDRLYLVRDDFRHVIEMALQMTKRRLHDDHVHLHYDSPAEIVPVKMVTGRLVKMMVHLIINSCDAMILNQEKILNITIQSHTGSPENLSMILIVADNGQGIPTEDMEQIFDPFFTSKEPGKGTGLGLSVCRGIIQEHGGTICAENNDNGGASFIVKLPLYHP